jgi:hypothetical protein
MENKTELDRLEKASSLVRNVVLIIGALATAAIFLSDRFSADVTAHVDTLYLGGKNTIISSPMANRSDKAALSGILGTLSEVRIVNNSKLPVALEVRIPRTHREEHDDKRPLFSIISAEPQCHLKKEEVFISNNGVITGNTVGSVEIAKFPPDCILEVVIASTQVDETTRFMSGKVEVFYDGKKAEIDSPTKIYGLIGSYLHIVKEKGVIGIFLYVLLPLLFFIFSIVWVMETLPKNRTSNL